MDTKDKLAEAREILKDNLICKIDYDLQCITSPTEELFITNLLISCLGFDIETIRTNEGKKAVINVSFSQHTDDWVIIPQASVGKYRVDFLISVGGKEFVVECDGHEFHEKTKEQVARDKKRERDLTKNDYIVVRFSGSEIYRNAEGCVEELAEIILNTLNKKGKK